MEKMIQKKTAELKPEAKAKQSINTMLNGILDGEGMRKRFNEVLGDRAPQFLSSIVSMVNTDSNLQECFYNSPMSIIQSALKAATYDLPVDPALGYFYIVPFNKRVKQADGSFTYQKVATPMIGYKGLVQLCLRTGAYSRIPDAVDVRDGELVSYDRLTGDAEFKWIEDEEERESRPVIGYAGYFRLKNGAEKTIYMTKKQVEAHEKKNRKGDYMGNVWKSDFDSMAKKTVIRRLCSHYGLMSIQYQTGDADTVNLATAIAEEEYNPDESIAFVDESTGEVKEAVNA